MADGNLVRQSNVGKDSVVFGPTVYDVPLLPYEKELIKTIGITEEEYRRFAAEVRRKGLVRPAEYEHIPDVQAIGTETLILIAVSLVLSGAAYLLTPKPKMPGSDRGGTRIDLGNVTGAGRFTPTKGFDTLAELGDYNSPIPFVFGLYSEENGGGMLVTPKLIWSRMFSHGTLQRAKLLYVVGEQGIDTNSGIAVPGQTGIFLGNNTLDPVYDDNFAFYWKGYQGDKTYIRADDFAYGTRGKSGGDPDVGDGDDDFVFRAPTLGEENDETAFCHAYSPVNSTQFGIYAPIANGQSYRLNYRIVSIIDAGSKENKGAAMATRIKYAGDNNEGLLEDSRDRQKGPLNDLIGLGQEGAGRNYSPRMGIIKITRGSTEYKTSGGDLTRTISVEVGDKASFLISSTTIPRKFYKIGNGKESVDDINTSVQALQVAADDALQVGELFDIGGSTWKVTKRKVPRFVSQSESGVEAQSQTITLECIDTSQSLFKKVGIVSENKVVNPDREYIGDSFPDGGRQSVGEGFFPLTRVETATVRNNRPAAVTELGIKSTVFQKLNGLCAFNSLPSPNELREYDKDDIQVQSGTITAFIAKSSIFRIFVKKVGSDEFAPIPRFFVVRGSRPVAQYNFVRLQLSNSSEPAELEYKLVQVPASELRSVPADEALIDLSHSVAEGASSLKSFEVGTVGSVGEMTVTVNGEEISKARVTENKEFFRGDVDTTLETAGSDLPGGVTVQRRLPDLVTGVRAETVEREGAWLSDSGYTSAGGKNAAFVLDMSGIDADSGPSFIKVVTQEYISNSPRKWIALEWSYERKDLSSDHWARDKGKTKFYAFSSARVLGSTGGFSEGEIITIKRGSETTAVPNHNGTAYNTNSNPFALNTDTNDTMSWSGIRLKVTSVANEIIPYQKQGFLYERFGDPENISIGETRENTGGFLTKTDASGTKTIKYKLQSTVETGNLTAGQSKQWGDPRVIKIQPVGSGTTDNWDVGDTFDDVLTPSSSNRFKVQDYATVGMRFSIGNVDKGLIVPVNDAEQKFVTQTQYSDISLYRDHVDKSNASEPEHEIVYCNEVQEQSEAPTQFKLALAGLSLKATRRFNRLDQLRVWLASGAAVERLHDDPSAAYGDSNSIGPSNLFTDLVYHLLTDQTSGAGALLGMNREENNQPLIDKDELVKTSRFLHTHKLFFNGAIVDRTNLRQYITDVAPQFLCNFIITDGKFALKPALPVQEASGEYVTGPVTISQIFTAGNILEDSFKIEYLGAEERRPFKAVVRFREENENKLPQERTIEVKGKGSKYREDDVDLLPVEQFDLTQFCTSEEHALQVAKYFLVLRNLVTHTVSFSTTLEGLDIKAGSYIRVITESSPYSSANNGTVGVSGDITSATELADGTYTVNYFKAGGDDDVQEASMSVSDGKVSGDNASDFYNAVFTVVDTTVSHNVYVVEQLTFSQEGTVDIVASEHPCDNDGKSKLVAAIQADDFKVL